jgi:hypothetical protein
MHAGGGGDFLTYFATHDSQQLFLQKMSEAASADGNVVAALLCNGPQHTARWPINAPT